MLCSHPFPDNPHANTFMIDFIRIPVYYKGVSNTHVKRCTMENPDFQYLTIKEFSDLTHTPIDTLKHYDRIGLLRPAYIGKENNYRYYLPEQSLLLTRIMFGTKAHIKLQDIKATVLADDTERTSTNYQNITRELEQNIDELKAAQSSLINLIYYYNLSKRYPLETLFSFHFPEFYMISTPKTKISGKFLIRESNIANDLFMKGFSHRHWPHYQLGAFFDEQAIARENFSNTSYYLKIDHPEDFPPQEITYVPGGYYLCYLTKGNGRNMVSATKQYLDHLKKAQLAITGNIFINDVVNNLITSDSNHYCTLIFAQEAKQSIAENHPIDATINTIPVIILSLCIKPQQTNYDFTESPAFSEQFTFFVRKALPRLQQILGLLSIQQTGFTLTSIFTAANPDTLLTVFRQISSLKRFQQELNARTPQQNSNGRLALAIVLDSCTENCLPFPHNDQASPIWLGKTIARSSYLTPLAGTGTIPDLLITHHVFLQLPSAIQSSFKHYYYLHHICCLGKNL